jgi:hypothetical protein
MSNSGTRWVQARAQSHARARIRETFTSRRGVCCRTHASAGRVTRALSRFWRGILRVFALLPVGGGFFARRRVNPVVATLYRVDRSPIGRARPRARPTTRSVGSTTGRRRRLTRYLCLYGASGSSSLPAGANARPAHFAGRYDVAASESQIEFGEAAIMETNELIGKPARKIAAPENRQALRLFRAGDLGYSPHPHRRSSSMIRSA